MALIFIAPFMLFGGFFSNQANYYWWTGWIQYLSPIKYGFEALAYNEFFESGFRPDPLEILGMTLGYWPCIGISLSLFVFFRILSYLALRLSMKKL